MCVDEDECCPGWWDEPDEEELAELQYRESIAEEDPNDGSDDDYWDDDPLDGYVREEPDYGCWSCGDVGCRRCTPSRWQRIRWAVGERIDRLLHPRGRQVNTGGFHDEPPF